MFALVALFGLFHGLIFLPVVLSLVGPQMEEPTKQFNSNNMVHQKDVSHTYENGSFQSPEKGLPTVNGIDNKTTSF